MCTEERNGSFIRELKFELIRAIKVYLFAVLVHIQDIKETFSEHAVNVLWFLSSVRIIGQT